MVLDNISHPQHERSEPKANGASLPISYHPYYTVWNPLKKEEKKLLKLQKKAQECVSRKKAQKILHKEQKWQKCLKA